MLEEVQKDIDGQGVTKDKQEHEKELYWALYNSNRKEEEKWRIKCRIATIC